MTESVLKEFQHNRFMVYLWLLNTILFGILGVIFIFGKPFLAVPYLACSVGFGINFFWSKKTPIVKMTTQKIIIHRSPFRSPKIIAWEQVSKMQQEGKNKIRLVLRDQGRIRIPSFGMQRTDIVDIVKEIQRLLQGKANQALHSDGNSAALRPRR